MTVIAQDDYLTAGAWAACVRTWLIELLLHVDLLGKTVQFLHEIRDISSLDSQDKMKWKIWKMIILR